MAEHEWAQFIALAAGTLLSEDGTCIAAGLLVRSEHVGAIAAVAACTLGILAGDLGLWWIGRGLGSRILAWPWVRRRMRPCRVDDLESWIDTHLGRAVLVSRFLPGTRLPTYLAAGAFGTRFGRFAAWTTVAALLWTPLVVGLVAVAGERFAALLRAWLGGGWLSFAGAVALLMLALRLARWSLSTSGRGRLIAGVSRLWRWEFWPAWLFYIPLMFWVAWLAIRYRGLTTATAANPGIRPHGGIVGESKFEILSRLPREWILPAALIPAGDADAAEARQRLLLDLMQERGWRFPIILKPDAGQRGKAVRLVDGAEAVRRYFHDHPRPVLAQVYHPGPFEAGLFYVRMPDEPRGRIFSITDKVFPVLTGDGTSTLETLILRHPQFRMQAGTFLNRMNGQAQRVLEAGERRSLTLIGNHCQGTMFRDGVHLLTPALEARIDAIARHFDGFFFGRFDVRYRDTQEFAAGRGFAIVELNGITSESTNLYDPSSSLWRAYQTLFRQWSILYRIGDRNRARGAPVSPLWKVIADCRAHVTAAKAGACRSTIPQARLRHPDGVDA